MILLCLAALASGVVDLDAAGTIEVADSAAGLVGDARAAYVAGDFAEAARLYRALADSGGGVPARLSAAVALYEGGELHAARAEAERALSVEPKNLAAANLLGLVLLDSGAVAAGMERLVAARKAAEARGASGQADLGRILVNLGLAKLDLGDAAGARADLAAGKAAGEAAGEGYVVGAASQGLAAVDGLAGAGSGVGAALSKGDHAGARARAQAAVASARVPRQKVAAAFDLAAVERAEGNLDAAATRVQAAILEARTAGMSREVAVGLGQLGLLYSLGGRLPIAEDTLRAGANEAAKGGYRVVEVDLRCELGLVLLAMERADAAEAEQRAAGVLLAQMSYPAGVARQGELGGQIAAVRGDLGTAEAALSKAVSFHEGLGHPLDAARVATALAAAWHPRDAAASERWATRAKGYYAAAGEKLGPAHLHLASALAEARARHLDAALQGFAAAAEAAEKIGGGRAKALARVARENAAETLILLGATEDVARLAAEQGVADLLARHTRMGEAFAAYDAGLEAYRTQRYGPAREQFVAARERFEALQEPDYALRAYRAAAWAWYNAAVALPPAQAWPVYESLLGEASRIGDPELTTRVYGAAAIAAGVLGQGDPGTRLLECVRRGESAGLPEVTARCHGALAERAGELDDRAGHARAALLLQPGQASAYAAYSVAVDAYNADRPELALELAKLAKPHAGNLAAAVDEVIAATTP